MNTTICHILKIMRFTWKIQLMGNKSQIKFEPKYLISPIFLSPLIKILYAMNAFKTSVPHSKGVNFRLLWHILPYLYISVTSLHYLFIDNIIDISLKDWRRETHTQKDKSWNPQGVKLDPNNVTMLTFEIPRCSITLPTVFQNLDPSYIFALNHTYT